MKHKQTTKHFRQKHICMLWDLILAKYGDIKMFFENKTTKKVI